MKGITVELESVPGDRCPSDSWRVTLSVDGEWMLYREWMWGLHDEHKDSALEEAKRIYNKIKDQLK